MNNTVQIPNFPPITMEEMRQAGIRWDTQRGLGPMPNWMPVTQEDKDQLGVVRNQKLKRLRNLAIASSLLSCVGIVIGIVTITSSAPDNNFPHVMGGAAVQGALVLLYCLLIFGILREGKKSPTGDTTTSCFRCLTTCNAVFTGLASTLVLCAFAFSGIWGLVDCATRKPEDDGARFTTNGCTPNTGSLYALAVLTLVLGSVLFILYMAMSFTICCNMRAFGIKSNYEVFSDYQMARMQAMNVQQQQQQQSVQQQQPMQQSHSFYPPQGQGQNPVQGHQGSHLIQPTAPLLPTNQVDGAYGDDYSKGKDDLPTYSEVIESGKYV